MDYASLYLVSFTAQIISPEQYIHTHAYTQTANTQTIRFKLLAYTREEIKHECRATLCDSVCFYKIILRVITGAFRETY